MVQCDRCPRRKEKLNREAAAHRGGGWPRDGEGRGEDPQAADHLGSLACNQQKLEEAREASPRLPRPSGEQGPADTLTADFQPLEMRDNTLLLFQATCSHSTNLPSSSSVHTLCWVLGTHLEDRRPGSGLAQGAIVMERLELEAGKGRTRLSRMGRASGPARWGLWDRPQRPSCLT